MMRRLAIFVEGQTEQIFLNHIIKTCYSYSNIKISNLKLGAGFNEQRSLHDFGAREQEIKSEFLIFDTSGDGTIASAVVDRTDGLIQKGFQEIFVLRDLMGSEWKRLGTTDLNRAEENIRSNFDRALSLSLRTFKYNEAISLHFAILEVEAWLLAFKDSFKSWGSGLNDSDLQVIAKQDLSDMTKPESLKNPKLLFSKLAARCGFSSATNFDTIQSFVSKIDQTQLDYVISQNLVPRFSKFFSHIIKLS